MSVIGYTKQEIVEALAASWNRGSVGSLDAQRYMGNLAEFGNLALLANTQAYNHTYHEETCPELAINAQDIKRALIQQTVAQKQRGLHCLRGIRYNLMANDGTDFATKEILDWLLSMFMGMTNREAQ